MLCNPKNAIVSLSTFLSAFLFLSFSFSVLFFAAFCTMKMLSVQSRIAITAHNTTLHTFSWTWASNEWNRFGYSVRWMNMNEIRHLLNFMWMHNNVPTPQPASSAKCSYFLHLFPFIFLQKNSSSEFWIAQVLNHECRNNNGECGYHECSTFINFVKSTKWARMCLVSWYTKSFDLDFYIFFVRHILYRIRFYFLFNEHFNIRLLSIRMFIVLWTGNKFFYQ